MSSSRSAISPTVSAPDTSSARATRDVASLSPAAGAAASVANFTTSLLPISTPAQLPGLVSWDHADPSGGTLTPMSRDFEWNQPPTAESVSRLVNFTDAVAGIALTLLVLPLLEL